MLALFSLIMYVILYGVFRLGFAGKEIRDLQKTIYCVN